MTAPTSDERREVAARLRDMANNHSAVDEDFVKDIIGLYRGENVDGFDPDSVRHVADLIEPAPADDDTSDGYHTFGQLYYQRMMLFSVIVNEHPTISWKTLRHEDGELCFGGGWFLVTIDTPEGSYGYHYETKYWDLFECKALTQAKHWDGYNEEDVTRLLSLIEPPKTEPAKVCGTCAYSVPTNHNFGKCFYADSRAFCEAVNLTHGGCSCWYEKVVE